MVENQEMKLVSHEPAKKRKFRQSFCPEEFTTKFSSKQDLYTYMSEHRKCDLNTLKAVL